MSETARFLSDTDRDFTRRASVAQMLHIDLWLLLPILAVMFASLWVLYSASNADWDTVLRHLRNQIIAFVAMLIMARFRPETVRRLGPMAFASVVLLLVLVPLVGVGAKGAQRWLSLGFIRFQPSELMKLAMPVMVAWWLTRKALPPRFGAVMVAFALVVVPSALIAIQPDLGTSLLIAASGLFVVFIAGIPWRFIATVAAVALASLWPAWQFLLKDYQRQRVLTLLNPEADRLGAGWNIIQSKTAIGSGGWGGKGWLEGTQSHLDFLPESQTDFIIAVLAEEFGFVGVLLLLAAYLVIIARGLLISLNAQSGFGRLLAAALTLTFFVYVFVNMGMVAGILPVVGVPLPLISFGGTSMVTLMVGFGLLMAISTERRMLSR